MQCRFRCHVVAAAALTAWPMPTVSWTTTDGPRLSPWSEAVNLGADVNSATGDFFPFVSRDGLSLYFTSMSCGSDPAPPAPCRPGFGGADIFVSLREGLDDPWGPAQNLGPAINTPANEAGAALSRNGHQLFFGSDRAGGFGGNDIYVSWRRHEWDDFGWRVPRNLGDAVNTPANESNPEVVELGTRGRVVLYFESNRPGGPGPFTDDVVRNGTDIYSSTREWNGVFAPATLIDELSSSFLDRQPTVRRDGLELILSSNRPGSLGDTLDLWVAVRASTSDPWSEPESLGAVVNSALAADAGPALSFDGRTLYFHSFRPEGVGGFDLYGAQRTRLTRRH